MNAQKKLQYLWDNYFAEYQNASREADAEISGINSTFCFCGRLATGFHESRCSKFKAKVRANILERLKHLLPK